MKRFVKSLLSLLVIPVLLIFFATPAQAYLTNEYFDVSNGIYFSSPDALGTTGNFVYYSQGDPKWASLPYGPSTTINASGCGPTSLAMIVATLIDPSVTPKDTAALGAANGSVEPGVGTIHLKLLTPAAAKWGFTFVNLTGQSLDAAIAVTKAGGLVYMGGQGPAPFTGSGHIVVMRGVDSDGNIIIADPYGNDKHRVRGADDKYPRSVIEAYRGSTFGITKI